jgi:type IV secretion system protein VirB10
MLVALKINQKQGYSPGRPDDSIFKAASDSAIQAQLKGETPQNLEALWREELSPDVTPAQEEIPEPEQKTRPRITYRKREAPTNDPMLKRMQDMKMGALLADTTKDAFTQSSEAAERQATTAVPAAASTPARNIGAGTIPGQGGQQADPNGQARKEEFFYTGGNKFAGGYLEDVRKSQLTAYELKIGTVIPAILLTGIDSDLPGQLLAQVSENVYDTATGRYLLIPQGSRLVGIYDSQVSYGQKRLMAAWTHLIWPDGSSLNLAGMPGIDPSGYSGFRGRVDNHYMELFLTAAVVSGFNFAYEVIADDESSNAYGNNSTNNKVKDAVGEAIAAIGAKIAERETARQPTIRIKPGYRFSVMLNKDVVFPSTWVTP